MPQLKDKLNGLSLRVPTATVSIVDLIVDLKKSASAEAVNGALKSAADSELNGILNFCDEPLVFQIKRLVLTNTSFDHENLRDIVSSKAPEIKCFSSNTAVVGRLLLRSQQRTFPRRPVWKM